MYQINIQGERHSYHEMAAEQHAAQTGHELTVVHHKLFDDVFDAVDVGEGHGLVAVNNTFLGPRGRADRLHANGQRIEQGPYRVLGRLSLPIDLGLIALPGAHIGDIKTVMSQDFALEQSAASLDRLLHPDVTRLEHHDTAASISYMVEEGDAALAAVASITAARAWGDQVQVLATQLPPPGTETEFVAFTAV